MDAEPRSEAGASGFVARLAERLGAVARASSIYGEPVERSGITVIPVARARWGFGGGGGEGAEGAGSGGGGGMIVSPIGYIEIKDGVSRFRPIVAPWQAVALVAFGATVSVIVNRLIRGR
jgi:uncharacterized spore protein YtfJ